MEQPVCRVCNVSLIGKESYDMWVFITRYNDEGEGEKTMLEPDHNKIPDDYIQVGVECCGSHVAAVWTTLPDQLGIQPGG